MQEVTREQYRALAGQTCYTATCQKNATDIGDRLSNETDARDSLRKRILDALSIPPNEPGCAPVPGEQAQ